MWKLSHRPAQAGRLQDVGAEAKLGVLEAARFA